MKILRLIYDWPPPWDGLAPGPYALTEAQAALGNQLVVVCGGGSLLLKKRLAAEIKNTKVLRLSRTLPKVGPFFTTSPLALLAYFYYKIKFRPDVVHGHGHITLWFNAYRYFFGWLDKTPYILHFHNTAAGREATVLRQGLPIPFLTRFVEWPLHKLSDYLGCLVANKLVFVSLDTAHEAENYYDAQRSKIVVLENGVDTKKFSSEGSKPPVFTNGPVLMYQGSLKPRKRADLLVRSLKHLPSNVNLILIGPKEEAISKVIREEDLSERVKMMGYLKNEDTPPYFRAATLFVLPSSYEGFPKVVQESLACGTPVLASGFSVNPPVSGLVVTSFETAEELAEAIKKQLESPQTVNVAAITKRFDWGVLASRLQETYHELL